MEDREEPVFLFQPLTPGQNTVQYDRPVTLRIIGQFYAFTHLLKSTQRKAAKNN
jgi:hypothetical protein